MFSPDKEQRFLYVCDINDNHVWFINRQARPLADGVAHDLSAIARSAKAD